MHIRYVISFFFVLLATSLSAQEYLVISEQPDQQATAKMPANTAQAIFIASTPDFAVTSSNKTVDKVATPSQNAQGLYEYAITLNLSGGHNARHFRVDKNGTTFFGETKEKVVFAQGEIRYFFITEPEVKISVARSDDKTHLVQDQACVEFTSPIPDLQIDVSRELYCDIKTDETGNGRYVTSIIINTEHLDFSRLQYSDGNGNIKEENAELWQDITTLRIFFSNSNIVSINIDGIRQRTKQRYTIITQTTGMVSGGNASRHVMSLEEFTFVTLNASYWFTPLWSCGFKVGQVKKIVGWYISGMSNFNFKGAFHPFVEGKQYDITGRTKTIRISAIGGIVIRPTKPVAIHVGVGFGYFTQTLDTQTGEWHSLPKNTIIGADVAVGVAFHIKKFMLSMEAVTTNFKTIEMKAGIGFALPTPAKHHK